MYARKFRFLASVVLACSLAASTTLPLAAAADETSIWIASGPEGGTYRDVYASNLQELLRGITVLYRDTEGSAQNIEMLQAGQADIAFAQSDVFAHAWQAGKTSGIQLIGRISDECVYIAYRKDGRIRKFDDLKHPPDGEPARVAVGPAASGPAGTWKWFSQRIPALAGNTVVDDVGTLSLNQLGVGRLDAVVWVTDPANRDHKMLKGALANDALAIMNVKDDALLAPLADGTVIYRNRKVTISSGWRPKKVETVCTSALLLMRRDAKRSLVERVSDIVSLKGDLIVPPPDRR